MYTASLFIKNSHNPKKKWDMILTSESRGFAPCLSVFENIVTVDFIVGELNQPANEVDETTFSTINEEPTESQENLGTGKFWMNILAVVTMKHKHG